MMASKYSNKQRMSTRLYKLVGVVFAPMMLAVIILMGLFMWYVGQYNTSLANVTSASEFNQDFKSEIDLSMYYYVSGSAYANGIPMEEVESARVLAEELLENTSYRKSIEAIESVRDLCVTLELRMEEIEKSTSYDDKMSQLENNIYILTDLIQTYMYNYLYYESVHLSNVQAQMTDQIHFMIYVIIGGLALIIFLLLGYISLVTDRITEPIIALSGRVRDITQGDFEPRRAVEASVTEIQSLSDGFENMTGQLNELIAKNKLAERKKRHAELELLQAQINPHFLYNTLDTIIWLIESDNKETSIEMVSALSDFFRSSLSKGRDVITIEEEKKHVLSYMLIQKTRYRDRMDYEIDIPESLYCYQLPKLTLQPLVENSIYHGIKMQREKGFIKVTAADIGETIELTVRDNGAGMTEERLAELKNTLKGSDSLGFGLRTVHERLQLFFGEEYGLQIQSAEGVGTTVSAIIPKLPVEKEEKGNA